MFYLSYYNFLNYPIHIGMDNDDSFKYWFKYAHDKRHCNWLLKLRLQYPNCNIPKPQPVSQTNYQLKTQSHSRKFETLGAQSLTRLARLRSAFAMNTHFHQKLGICSRDRTRGHVLHDLTSATPPCGRCHSCATAFLQIVCFWCFWGVCQLAGSNPSGRFMR